MFESIKGIVSLASGGWVKFVVGIMSIAAVLFGVYEYGSSHGYQKGYQKAWDIQQQTITKMVDAQNAETKAQNSKISDLEQRAANADEQVKIAQEAIKKQREQIVQNYKTKNPKVSAAPAWSPETVGAINQMLGAQK